MNLEFKYIDKNEKIYFVISKPLNYLSHLQNSKEDNLIVHRISVVHGENIYQSKKFDGNPKIIGCAKNHFSRMVLKRFLKFYGKDQKLIDDLKFTNQFSLAERNMLTK